MGKAGIKTVMPITTRITIRITDSSCFIGWVYEDYLGDLCYLGTPLYLIILQLFQSVNLFFRFFLLPAETQRKHQYKNQ